MENIAKSRRDVVILGSADDEASGGVEHYVPSGDFCRDTVQDGITIVNSTGYEGADQRVPGVEYILETINNK